MIPINREHIEAKQEEQNRRKKVMFEALPEKELERLMIVEDCCKKMEDAGILFFLFPCPNPEESGQFWQYNSLGTTIPSQENGEMDMLKLESNNRNFIYAVLKSLFNATNDKIGLIKVIEYTLFGIMSKYKEEQENK